MTTQTIKEQIEDLKLNQDDLTTSDIQGIALSISQDSMKRGFFIDDELILSYVYGKISIDKVIQ